MPSTVRVTIVQPDPDVPVDRFGPWLAGNRVLLRAVPLWRRPVPNVDDLGDGLIVLGGRMSVHEGDPCPHCGAAPLASSRHISRLSRR